ncbi:predicted protein [Streptomyces sp. SPB78]|nr:predicted protein [Streptomyces sp. SPB78]
MGHVGLMKGSRVAERRVAQGSEGAPVELAQGRSRGFGGLVRGGAGARARTGTRRLPRAGTRRRAVLAAGLLDS